MPKWKRQDETVCMPNTVCCAMAADGEEARLIVAAHNADIDALTAERDEWKRRLDEVLVSLKPGEEPMRYMLGDQKVDYRPAALLYARALTIAEGRDNG